jgi:hypothetical protein
VGAQILKAAIDHDFLLLRGGSHRDAIQQMARLQGVYHPEILQIMAGSGEGEAPIRIVTLNFEDIVPGMIADEDILAKNGTVLIPRGQEISWALIQSLNNFLEHIGIRNPVRVRVDADSGYES